MALMAGIARTVISPPLDIPNGMWVAQKHVRAEGLDMELLATVLALADGKRRLALIDLDLCFLPDSVDKAVREAVHVSTGIPSENVLPFCTHSHAGPPVLEYYRGEGEDRAHMYKEMLPHWIAGAAVRAVEALKPARTAAGVGRSEIGINRDLRHEGRFLVACNPDGFFDPEVGVIRIDQADGKPLACLVNYGCHPTVLGPGNKLASPDYPGSTRKIVEQVTGSTCFFLQGGAGNVGPIETFVADAGVARRLGTILGLEAARVYLELQTRPTERKLRNVIASGAALADYENVSLQTPEPCLKFAREFVQLPTRSPFAEVYEKSPERLAEWEGKLKELAARGGSPEQLAEALQHVTREHVRTSRMHKYQGKKTLPVETYAIQLGDAAIVTISGEPYSEIGAEVKRRSPLPKKTLFAGYEGGDMMYIPSADVFAFDPPPMEVDNSPYAPEAARIATEHLVNLLNHVAAAPAEITHSSSFTAG